VGKVGIIANPASGKDVRRLVASASVMDNVEKTNQIKRIILGMDSTGVEEVLIMPDYFNFGGRIIPQLATRKVRARLTLLDMPVSSKGDDSMLAAKMMEDLGAGCIVTLGGDGTNRAVAKGSCAIPLIPISTGTNNVFPTLVEATTAGMAAGIVAREVVERDSVVKRHKRLVVVKNGRETDMALVDVVVLDQLFTGSRAVWGTDDILQIICTRAEPKNMGLSSIAGSVQPVGPWDPRGVHVKIGEGQWRVRAAIVPGLFTEVGIERLEILLPGESIALARREAMVALDGERELTLHPLDEVRVRLQLDGPPVVDVDKALTEAASKGFFIVKGPGQNEPA